MPTVLALFATGRVYLASSYRVDGVSGKVDRFYDVLSSGTRWVQQATSGNQCVVPAGHTDYGGRLCATYAGAEWYDSNEAAATFDYLHNGTGFWCVHVFTPTSLATLVALATRTALGVGYQMYWSGTAPHSAGANGAAVTFDATAATGVANGTPTYIDSQYTEGVGTPEWQIFSRGTALATGDSTLAPSGAAASGPLRIGAQLSGANAAFMRWWGTLIRPSAPSTAERFALRAALIGAAGIAA